MNINHFYPKCTRDLKSGLHYKLQMHEEREKGQNSSLQMYPFSTNPILSFCGVTPSFFVR